MFQLANKLDMELLSLVLKETKDILDIECEILHRLFSGYRYPVGELSDMRSFLVKRHNFLTKKFQNEAERVKKYEDTLANMETFVANLAEKHVDL